MNDRANVPAGGPRSARELPGRAERPAARPAAVAEVQALLGRRAAPSRPPHRAPPQDQDRYGHLADRHLVAARQEMKLSDGEVYEVATFYHHFDVVREGEAAPPAVTVRVCDSISCELAGAKPCLSNLGRRWPRRARDRCALHRPMRDGSECGGGPESLSARDGREGRAARSRPARRGIRRRPARRARAPRRCGEHPHLDIVSPTYIDIDALSREVWVPDAARRSLGGQSTRREVIEGLARSRAARRRFPRGRSARPRAEEEDGALGCAGSVARASPWAAVAGGRAQTGPRYMAVNIDEGEPGHFKDRWYLEATRIASSKECLDRRVGGADHRDLDLSPRRVPRHARDPGARARSVAADLAQTPAAHSSATRPARTSAAKSPR